MIEKENIKLSGKVVTKTSLVKNYCPAEEYHQNIWKKDKMSLVDTSWLENNIDKVKIIDCSWHMPQTQRNGFEEYIRNIFQMLFFLI